MKAKVLDIFPFILTTPQFRQQPIDKLLANPKILTRGDSPFNQNLSRTSSFFSLFSSSFSTIFNSLFSAARTVLALATLGRAVHNYLFTLWLYLR
jgi:hypothetical protein